MYVSAHKDDAGALVLVDTLPLQCTPGRKYGASKTVELLKIDTKEQLGNIFIKGLHRPQFEYLRKTLMGK